MSNTSSISQTGFINAPNQFLPLQNNNPGMSHLGSVGTSNMVQTSMNTQPQLGASNHQNPMPFMPNMPPSIPQAALMNANNNILALLNYQLGMPHMSSFAPTSQMGQFNVGLGPQNSVNYMNYISTLPFHGKITQNAAQMNLPQPMGQLLAQNFSNVPQQHNLNMNMPKGQFCAPSPFQNINQSVPVGVPNPSQGVTYGLPHPLFGVPNQLPQSMVPQNPNFSSYPQLGLVNCNQFRQQVNQNQKNLAPPKVDTNVLSPSPVASQQLQGNNSAPCNYNPKPFDFTNSQGNPINNSRINIANSNWKGSPSKNFTNKQNRGVFQGGSQKSKFQNMNNAKRKFGFPKEQKGKGLTIGRAEKLDPVSSNQAKELKRPSSVIYTEQEIQQWREARRKNHPSKANSEHNDNLKDPELDREARIRREQLKEILAKQAELGVEVAEIPSCYLSDSQKQASRRQGDRKHMSKKGRFQNKFDKRGRYDKRDRFAKKQKLSRKDVSNDHTLNKRSPTLLQKLLSADIKKDKSCLLQVFRFMTMNSFFEDWPDKRLKYPSVVVKDIDHHKGDAENKYMQSGKDVSECGNKIMLADGDCSNIHKNVGKDEDEDDNDNNGCDEQIAQDRGSSYFIKTECSSGNQIQEPDEEEGEIID